MLNFSTVLSDFPTTGHVFDISGKVDGNAQKFNVTLACGTAGYSDIALMIDCNINDGKIIRTSLTNGAWSQAESDENLAPGADSNPLKRGEDFEIYILVGDDRFHVSINEKAYCTFKFQLPVNSIRSVNVSGDVECLTKVDHIKVFPLIYPLINTDTENVVFSAHIPRNYEPGHVIALTGTAFGNPQGEFVIFFMEEDTSRQLIHFNPRFDQQEVVINTMLGDEE